jgi:hypothetical protein
LGGAGNPSSSNGLTSLHERLQDLVKQENDSEPDSEDEFDFAAPGPALPNRRAKGTSVHNSSQHKTAADSDDSKSSVSLSEANRSSTSTRSAHQPGASFQNLPKHDPSSSNSAPIPVAEFLPSLRFEGSASPQSLPDVDPAGRRSSQQSPDQHVATTDLMDQNWTSITAHIDDDALQKILTTYFTWEHPGFSPICPEPFLKDFAARRRRFCSQALVHAIIARILQMTRSSGKSSNKDRIGMHYNRAQALLAIEKPFMETPYPYIQTLSVLACVDIVYGRLEHAWKLGFAVAKLAILDAMDQKPRPTDEEYSAVKANTFCGGVTLPL